MTRTHTQRPGAEAANPTWVAEELKRSCRRADLVRERANAAQRSAADSMEKSAGSHERVAKSYEMAAASSGHDEYLQHAARHREFAREDLRIAERLRQMAEGDDG